MKKNITPLLIALFSLFSLFAAAQNIFIAESPDASIQMDFNLVQGKIYYSVNCEGLPLLRNSALGFEAQNGDFTQNLKITDVVRTETEENYTLRKTKHSNIEYRANRYLVTVENAAGNYFEIEFLLSGHNLAFRYLLPQNGESAQSIILREITAFHFPDGITTTFLTPQALPLSGWMRSKPSYEEEYQADALPSAPSMYGAGYTFPALFRVQQSEGERRWALVSETGLSSLYCGSRLSEASEGATYTVQFPQPMENAGTGSVSPAVPLPGATPWRTITAGSSLKPIVEGTIASDVVRPLYEAATDYKFGRATWSWIMWQDQSMNFDDQMTYIDLAAEMGYEYVLIDALWDKNLGYEKTEELIRYAQSKNVDVLLWYNSNGAWNDAPQGPKNRMNTSVERKKEMTWLRQMGVKGLKVDFFGGDKQETVKLYEDILSDANQYGLLIIFHGATLPRGWERMYPNFAGSEAVLASENLIFTQRACDLEAFSACLHPFIRNAAASMEFGPVLLNKRHNRHNNGGSIRRTGDIFQLATAVLFQNPVQMFAIAPNNLTDVPAFEIEFMKKIPTLWDQTLFIDGYPGRYCVLARRNGDKWYIAAVNAEKTTRKIKLNLDFVNADALLKYADDKNLQPTLQEIVLPKNRQLTIEIPTNGAVVITGK